MRTKMRREGSRRQKRRRNRRKSTMIQKSQELRCTHWDTHSFISSFTCTPLYRLTLTLEFVEN